MPDLDRLDFGAVRDAYPDRYSKCDLAASQLVEQGEGMWVVRRDESDQGHVCHLVRAGSRYWGRCGCDGYEWHDGPCSHLCALHRAADRDLLSVPSGRLVRASVEVVDAAEERAQTAAEPEERVATDGGGPP